MNGLQDPQEKKKLALPPVIDLFADEEKKEEELMLPPVIDLFPKEKTFPFSLLMSPREEEKKEEEFTLPPVIDLFAEEPVIPEVIEPEIIEPKKETIPQRRLLPLGSKLAGLQEMAEKLFPSEKPLETVPMGGGLLREVTPPDVQERMAEATREPYKLDLEKALQSVDKAGADVLHGGIETATGLVTGIPTFLAATVARGGETFFNVLKDAYNSWKVGFKNVETFASKPVAQYLLKTAGESTTVSDFLHKAAEPWQPKTETGMRITETALAPVNLYMAGVRKIAELTSDDPGIQEGIVWLGDVALIFAIPKAKSYIKNQIRTKAPIITSKLKGMIIESDKVPKEIKQKTAAVPDVVPEEPVAPAPKVAPLPEPTAHVGEGGWSPEAISRAKETKFFLYDTKIKKSTPIVGIDAVDVSPGPVQMKFQKNLKTGEITLLDKGEKVFITPQQTKIIKEAVRKELTEKPLIKEPEKSLTKKVMSGELALELKKKLGKEEITEKPEVKIKKQNFARVSVVTPTGEIEPLGKFPERDISRVTDYAKSKGLSEKVIIGRSVKEAWEEGYSQKQRQASIEKRIDQLGKVPKEKWIEWEKKHAGYPMTEEIKKAIDAIQKRRGTEKRIKLEELKTELQKTDAGKVEWNFIEQEKELKELKKPTYRKAIDAVEHAVVDTSGNIKRKLIKELGWRGQAAAMEKNRAAGASSWATHLIEEAQNEIYGKGKSALSKKEEVILNRYLQSARTTAIHEYKPEVKRPGGLYDEHFEWQKDVPVKIKQAAVKYNKTMFEQLDALHKEGIITTEEVKNLKSVGMYEKSKFIDYIDPKRPGFSPGGTRMNVPDSGIKALKEGSERALELDSRLLLKEVVTRTQGRIFNNRANKALHVLAKDVPDNGIVSLAKVIGKTKKGIPKYEKTPARHMPVKVMIDGKPKLMFMPDEHATEWIKRDPLISQGLAQTVQWLSGNKILKAMATGINPGFAVTNPPRDIAHIFLTTDVYSKHMPVFGAQMLKDLMETRKDAFGGKGEWINALREGIGMNWLTFQGRAISGRTGTKLAKYQDALGKAGEVSERWTRLALRQRGIKMGMTPKEATAQARDYLDFYQGGNVMKALDQGIPYLNAGIQGTRGITRAIGRAPGKTAYKIGQIITLAAGLYLANNKINKECYDSIGSKDKEMNFIITTPFSLKDKRENKRYLFFKIAKDQGQRIFCSLTENMLNKLTGKPVNVDEITGSAQDAIQILPLTSLPPTISAILGYTANKDWWLNEDIWKGPKVKPGEEKTIYTHPALEKAGKVGLSPERLDYALKQIFTRGNIYTSIVSGGAGFLVNGLPEKDKGKVLAEVITRLPIIRRVFELTPPYSPKELKEQEKVKVEENTRKQKQKLELNKMANEYYRKLFDEKTDDKSLHKKIEDYIDKQPDYDQKRLTTWINDYGEIYDIPEKSWWLQLMNQSPEVGALLFFNKYIESSKEKQKEMAKLADKLPSITSDRFNNVFNPLFREYKKAVK